jgi:hypothetical protein
VFFRFYTGRRSLYFTRLKKWVQMIKIQKEWSISFKMVMLVLLPAQIHHNILVWLGELEQHHWWSLQQTAGWPLPGSVKFHFVIVLPTKNELFSLVLCEEMFE